MGERKDGCTGRCGRYAQFAGPYNNDPKTAKEYYIDPTCPKHQGRLKPKFRVVLFRWAPGLSQR